jgi:hypothetical protein
MGKVEIRLLAQEIILLAAGVAEPITAALLGQEERVAAERVIQEVRLLLTMERLILVAAAVAQELLQMSLQEGKAAPAS